MAEDNTQRLDAARKGVLDRMEAGRRLVRLAIIGGAMTEGLLLALAVVLVDWHDKAQILSFVLATLGYSVIVFGLLALAGHVTRATERLLAVLDAGPR
ncbi:hypothetical protein QO010_002096 [Caulobacter ginsengisoli]|uniref:Phage holin family protein n=1 Tax=Caulobacter ginsengisoli TaxID=400775 RepID=A0ABU0IQM3_9CAUL|nr:hypothetical protein [Caulobacter ginsengisoli]MDQ0464315.1 hypothetical protein [Caulobacter ginsengisoli]